VSESDAARRALERVVQARARLVLERPFLGELALALDPVAEGARERFATDGRRIFVPVRAALAASPSELQFLLAHQVLHCALGHFARRQHRIEHAWALACDYAVNPLLVDDGLQPPAGALVDPRFCGLSAEEIYPLLAADAPGETLDEHASAESGFAFAPSPGESRAADALPEAAFFEAHRDGFDEIEARAPQAAGASLEDWKQRVAAAAAAAASAGRLNPHWQRAFAEIAHPRLPWRELLARFVASVARDDYSWMCPGRRNEAGSGAILPGLRAAQCELLVALDTSGSIAHGELEEFLDELDALHGQVRARVTLTACDEALAPGAPWTFEPWERIELPKALAGGGGTRFSPVFEWAERERQRPDALLYFTDAQGEFPERAPDYPVLWVVKGNGTVPWGERVQLAG
jgi:predicted metal-dependent peptidase